MLIFQLKVGIKILQRKDFKRGGRGILFCKKKTDFLYIYTCNLIATGIVF